VLIGLLAVIVSTRFSLMDRSRSGWVMHRYAQSALRSLPPKSLLLSHTDLDWNPMRYLRECEGERADDVVQLSFQLMPYQWFRAAQQPLYEARGVAFPELQFAGVSTARASEGNAKLVRDVVLANGALSHTLAFLDLKNSNKKKPATPFPGGIYIDMQSISDMDLGDGYSWRGLTLQPYGTLYRVVVTETVAETAALHGESLRRLAALRGSFAEYLPRAGAAAVSPCRRAACIGPLAPAVLRQYPAGTWEFAAFSVINDAQYHAGMALLTFAISQQPALKADNMALLALLVDRLDAAAELLSAAHAFASAGVGGALLSSPLFDVTKNAALSWLRLVPLCQTALKFRELLVAALEGDEGRASVGALLLNPRVMDEVVSEAGLARLQARAAEQIGLFLRAFPSDKDAPAFREAMQAAASAVGKKK